MNELLYPLLFVINKNELFTVNSCFATTTHTQLPFCNRVGNSGAVQDEDVLRILTYFKGMPFRWFVDAKDTHTIETLEDNGLVSSLAFPAMQMSLSDLSAIDYGDIVVTEVVDDEGLQEWIAIVKQSYGMISPEFDAFVAYQEKHASPGVVRFYLASRNGVNAAASMTIRYENVVGLHWVGTLAEHRKNGLGFAASHKPLLDAKQDGCTTATLFASELGKPVYERIGFCEYARYNTYGPAS